MSLNGPYDDDTWELIAAALQGDLSPEEELRFREWLDASPGNKDLFRKLSHSWSELDRDEMALFQGSDDAKAWAGLQLALQPVRMQPARWWVAAAAVFLILGGGWWFFFHGGPARTYETAAGEQRTVTLPDGSNVKLQPQTLLEVPPGFGVKERTVLLKKGTAGFEVAHLAGRTFTVEMDAARVQDIGTQFTITLARDSLSVSVSEGKVAFLQKSTGLSREIGAGAAICLYTGAGRSGEIRELGVPSGSRGSLNFANAPISTVLQALEKHWGRSIRLNDPEAGRKLVTIKLEGESLEESLQVVCATAHLKYTLQSGGYVLETTDSIPGRK